MTRINRDTTAADIMQECDLTAVQLIV